MSGNSPVVPPSGGGAVRRTPPPAPPYQVPGRYAASTLPPVPPPPPSPPARPAATAVEPGSTTATWATDGWTQAPGQLASADAATPAGAGYRPAGGPVGLAGVAQTPHLSGAGLPGSGSLPPSARTTGARPSGVGGRLGLRLEPGWIAFIVLDIVLVITAILVVAASVGGGSREPAGVASPPPAAVRQPVPDDAWSDKPTAQMFASPTRNIGCEVTEQGATCTIATLGAGAKPPVECTAGTAGHSVTLDAEGVHWPCLSDGRLPKAASGSTDVLDYEESKTVGDYTCVSERKGVTCRHFSTGHGFRLARAGVQEF